jgi:soluble lytic murein transglycosylase-like protein
MYEQHASNPIFSAFKTAAAKYGVPNDVALRLGWVEGKFQDHGVNSAGASGPAQVRGFVPASGKPVHDTESLKLFGKRVKDLTPEENVDLGMRILAREAQKAGGDWRVAVKRYLGAEKGDVNLTGEQYANLIF